MGEKYNHRNIPIWLVIILVAVVAFGFTKIDSLESDIQLLKNRHADEIFELEEKINNIYDDVDAQLKKQTSLLSGVQYNCGMMDPETCTVPVLITIVPKTITDDMQLSIQLGEETAMCVWEDSGFSATISANLFLDYDEIPLLLIKTAEGTQTEYLEDVTVSNLWCHYLPTVCAENMSGNCGFDGKTLSFDAEILFDCYMAEECDVVFHQFFLVVELNGKEIERKNVTPKVKSSDSVMEGLYTVTFTEHYSVSEEDKLVVYVLAEDTLGYVHKNIAYSWYQSNDMTAETAYGGEWIYDNKGNLLYGEKE